MINNMIPNKLQNQIVFGKKCKVHKFRRFSTNNKTYRTDLYYCEACGHNVEIARIFGKQCICWKCGNAFSIPAGMTKLFPTCKNCTPLDSKHKKHETNEKEDFLNELLSEIDKK